MKGITLEEVLVLYNEKRWSVLTIAKRLGCTPQNIYNHLKKAREKGLFVRPSHLYVNEKMTFLQRHWKTEFQMEKGDPFLLAETLTPPSKDRLRDHGSTAPVPTSLPRGLRLLLADHEVLGPSRSRLPRRGSRGGLLCPHRSGEVCQ